MLRGPSSHYRMAHHPGVFVLSPVLEIFPSESVLRSAASTADNGAERQETSASAAAAGAEAALSSLVSPVFSMQGVRYGLITACCLGFVLHTLGHDISERYVCVTRQYFI